MPGTSSLASKRLAVAPVARRLVELLDLQPEDLVVSLGAHPSHCCLAMLEQVSLRYQMVVVDASPDRLDRLANVPGLRVVGMSALAFARFPAQWDKILLDDALVAEDGDGAGEDGAGDLLSLLFTQVRPGGRLIAFPSAWTRRRSAALQRSMCLAARVKDSGFEVSFDATQRASDPYDLVIGSKPISV